MIHLRDIDPTFYRRESDVVVLGSATASERRTIKLSKTAMVIGSSDRTIPATNIDLDIASNWDSATQNMAIAANRAGSNIYVYATADKLIVSPNSTMPTGYTATNSRKFMGLSLMPPYFATATDKTPIYTALPGLAASHPAYGFLAGDTMPPTIWDLDDMPDCLSPGQ